MANPRKHDLDDRSNGGDGDFHDDEASSVSSGGGEVSAVASGLTERLTDILVDRGDGDLLLQRSDREDNRVLQWLQALDMQVIGACRADERLKPLLKLNAPGGVAEDWLVAHLSQHFEVSEVGMLARCFCIPLVSIRVGKINKQGTLLCPTAIRGNLNLTVLPTSDLRLLFIGDDGNIERLFTTSGRAQCSAVAVDEIPADASGRSFQMKFPDGGVYYFWCSEKSKLLGIELLAKMKDILKRKPSIAELTGISKSRLDRFASHLRAYLLGSNTSEGSAFFPASTSTSTEDLSDPTMGTPSKPMRSRHVGSQAVKGSSPYQGSLSPRSSTFKEGLTRSLSSFRTAAREKLRRRGDSHFPEVDGLMAALPCTNELSTCSIQSEIEKLPEIMTCPVMASNFLESVGKLSPSVTLSPACCDPSISPPLFSPNYCWCPQGASTLQSASPELPTSSIGSPLLPPLSSLLAASRSSSLLSPTPPLSLADVPSLDFPALFPDPLVRVPMPSSQQIATFTPLMCDPIVHIPVIDVCSSGQGYLVSTGATMPSTIPPLHPKLVSPLISEHDSMLEKGARETLRLLISSTSQAAPQLMDVLPAVLTNANEKQTIIAARAWGLHTGTKNVEAITNGIATMGLASLSESSIGDGIADMHDRCDNSVAPDDSSSGLVGSCSDDGTSPPTIREGGTS